MAPTICRNLVPSSQHADCPRSCRDSQYTRATRNVHYRKPPLTYRERWERCLPRDSESPVADWNSNCLQVLLESYRGLPAWRPLT